MTRELPPVINFLSVSNKQPSVPLHVVPGVDHGEVVVAPLSGVVDIGVVFDGAGEKLVFTSTSVCCFFRDIHETGDNWNGGSGKHQRLC